MTLCTYIPKPNNVNVVISTSAFHAMVLYSRRKSIKDVTVNAKNNFGDTLDAMYNIACARSVSENVGLLLKNSYVVSGNFDLVLFLGNAFVPR